MTDTRPAAAVALLNNIAEELKITDKNTVINIAMAMLVKEGGLTVEAAVNALFGADGWNNLVGTAYEQLRAKAA